LYGFPKTFSGFHPPNVFLVDSKVRIPPQFSINSTFFTILGKILSLPTFGNIPLISLNLRFFYILYLFFVSPQFDHVTFMHHTMHLLDAPARRLAYFPSILMFGAYGNNPLALRFASNINFVHLKENCAPTSLVTINNDFTHDNRKKEVSVNVYFIILFSCHSVVQVKATLRCLHYDCNCLLLSSLYAIGVLMIM